MSDNISVVFKNAEDKININEWSDALDILNANDYDNCDYDELEKVIWLKIECWSIAAARVFFASTTSNEQTEYLDNISEKVAEVIGDLYVLICSNNKQPRIGEMYVKYYDILTSRFISMLDEALANITTFQDASLFHLFAIAHDVFRSKQLLFFMIGAEKFKDFDISVKKIEEETDSKINDIEHRTIQILCQKQYEKATAIVREIYSRIPDFPYLNCPEKSYTNQIIDMYFTAEFFLENIIDKAEDELKAKSLKLLIAVYCDELNCIVLLNGKRLSINQTIDQRNEKSRKITEYQDQLRKYIKDYEHPPYRLAPLNDAQTANNGCYIATAVYGSYDCPQVWTLRRYRDYTLAETWYGRAFIKTYYAISPTLVKWFGHTKWFKKMWQSKLDHMIAKLQANGVEATPYEDKNW